MTPPATPPSGSPPIRSSRIAVGVGAAVAGHLLTVVLGVAIGAALGNEDYDAVGTGLAVALGGQVLLFVACLVASVLLVTRGDRGLGLGVIIGWAAGLMVTPVVGFGVCIWALQPTGGAV
ncbi:MAG TPA: hypothetical protein VFB84_17315 [Micromonosporaceae bacterium]|nr:hypothetical protein [Micromonosporaceae bacterium]